MTFSERVIKIARSIPRGRVTTYGRIAKAAGGGPMASRSITRILSTAWENGIIDIPFHRIVYANGRIWIDAKHQKQRMKLYKDEGISIDSDRIKNFPDLLYELR